MTTRLYRLENYKPHDFGGPVDLPFEPLEQLAAQMPLHRLIERHAETLADKPAVITLERTLTFGELIALAHRFVSALVPLAPKRNGIKPVFCLTEDSCTQVAVALACWRLGLAHAPTDPDMPWPRLSRILLAETDAIVIGESDFLGRSEIRSSGLRLLDSALEGVTVPADLPDRASPDALASIVFTSGSTGEPKGIVHNQRAIAMQMAAKARNGHLNKDDCAVYVGAVFVAGWQRNALPMLTVGATALFLPAKTPVERILVLNRQYGVTVFGSYVGTARLLARHTLAVTAFQGVRILTMFGDALTWRDIDAMRAVLPEHAMICSSYSQSEHWRICSWFIDDAVRQDGERVPVGFPPPDTRVALLVDDDHAPHGGATGEIVVESTLLAAGSWPDPAPFQERLVPDPECSDRPFFRTGDILRQREDGMLVFVGRVDNQVKINGWRIEPEEIERVAAQDSRIESVACMARFGETGRAELLVLFVVPARAGDVNEVSVRERLAQNLPDYMVPTVVHVIAGLPLTTTGKTDRVALARLDAEMQSQAARFAEEGTLETLWPDPAKRAIAALIAREVRQSVIRPDQSLISTFGDSLEALTIALEIEKQFGVSLDPTDLLTETPLGTIVDDVCARRQGA